MEKQANIELPSVAFGGHPIDEDPARIVGQHVERLDSEGAPRQFHQAPEEAEDLLLPL